MLNRKEWISAFVKQKGMNTGPLFYVLLHREMNIGPLFCHRKASLTSERFTHNSVPLIGGPVTPIDDANLYLFGVREFERSRGGGGGKVYLTH